MIVFALIAAAGLAFTSGTFRLVVIMIGLDFFIASFAIGVGGVGWTLQGEVFPTAVRGQAAAFAAMIDWLANFALIEVFPVTQNAISLGGVLVVFAGLCALAIVFIWKFLPETKGLPVEDIIGLFEKQQKQSLLSCGTHACVSPDRQVPHVGAGARHHAGTGPDGDLAAGNVTHRQPVIRAGKTVNATRYGGNVNAFENCRSRRKRPGRVSLVHADEQARQNA